MGSGLEHASLAVFTTLAPMAAASFLVVAYAVFAGGLDKDAMRRLDRWTALPLAVLCAGFLGAFTHLASPLGAAGVFAGIGRSPLSNEIVAGVAFAGVAVVYWALCMKGKLGDASSTPRRALLVACCVLAIVFAAFCGLAYMIETVPTWNTPASIVQILGYALVGGSVLGSMTVCMAKIELPGRSDMAIGGMAVAGIVVALAGWAMQMASLGGMRNIWGTADALVPMLGAMIAVFAVCGIVGAAYVFIGSKKVLSPTVGGVCCAVVACGIFVARIAFYGLYMGVAL